VSAHFWEESYRQEHRTRHAMEDEIAALREQVAALETDLRRVKQWFRQKPWDGELDRSAFGGHPYSPNERALGYGTYRDPRFLPPALREDA
jgi:hypothetical protein